MNVNYLDIILVVVVIVLTIRCIYRGFIEESLSMAALVGGIAGGVLFSGLLASLLTGWIGPAVWNPIIGFLVAFLVIYLIVKLLEGAIQAFFDKFNLEKLDKVLGLFLGLIEGVLFCSLAVFVLYWLRAFPYLNTAVLLKGSFTARLILPLFVPGA
jgi:membrane protein required for colicin V production